MQKTIVEFNVEEGIQVQAVALIEQQREEVRRELEEFGAIIDFIDADSVRAHFRGDYELVKKLERKGWSFKG